MNAIVITEFMEEAAIREILGGFAVHHDASLADKPQELSVLIKDARALIVRNRTQVRAELLAAAPKLECVGRLGVGLDNIDMPACEARGVAVYPAIGANEVSVAEYVIGAIIMLMRGAYHVTPAVVAGTWPRTELAGREVAGKRLGLIGYGNNARETATRALALGMTVSAFDPHVPADHPAWTRVCGRVVRETLDDIVTASDAISIHVPLTPDTKNLVDATALARMKNGAIVINAARGGIVEEDALVAALKSGRIGGAALDVFADEPLSAERGAVFANCPNLILTPHVAGVTIESNIRTSRITAENVRRHLVGQ
jgi:(S)-sulfolactate dehydrogenase